MNLVATEPSSTMTSLDLLDIINQSRIEAGESPHEPRKFLAKVEDELDDLTGKKFRLNNNQTRTGYYDLTLDQCLLVGMRESKAVRRSVLAQLKKRQKATAQLPDFSNPAAAARAWADEVEQKQKLELAYEEAKPAVQFVEKYVESEGLLGFRQVCKTLGAKENAFRAFLLARKIMYYLDGKLTAYSQHSNAGRFVTKAGVNEKSGHSYTETKFTAKGVSWIAGEWAKYQLQEAF